MAIHQPRLHLICYDIADPRRLGRVHRFLTRHAVPVQYSVFIVHASAAQVAALLVELGRLIHPRQDDVRCYPLPARLEFDRRGRQLLPEGVQLAGQDVVTDLFSLVAPDRND
jgi:CRISPR-associated protein Cas2